jgi:hypothetical protein
MTTFSRRHVLVGGVSCFTLAGLAPRAWANGDNFFVGTEIPGQIELLYIGSVKDEDGNHMQGVKVTLTCSEPALEFVTYTDVLGRFRTADAGRGMLELGYSVDEKKLDITVAHEGYTQSRRMHRKPYKADRGAFEVLFVMKKN